MKFKNAIISIILIFSIACYIAYYNIKKTYNFSEPIIFAIEKGTNQRIILESLEKQNLITNIYPHLIIFKIINIINPKYSFKAGEYQISSKDNYYTLIKKLLNGDNYYHKLTFIEGNTVTNVINKLKNSNLFINTNIQNTPKQGSLLPETYYIKKNTDIKLQLNLMQQKLDKILDEAWDQRADNLPLKNKYELLILASIVEKETGLSGERARVAGVFINRLRLNMKLQSDPTVIYAITKGKYKLERPLSRRDLRLKSPYNSYETYGLPPTPICNPGKAAILATANSAITKDLYFVSNGKGEHRFSKTLKEHNINVRKLRNYEKILKQQKN